MSSAPFSMATSCAASEVSRIRMTPFFSNCQATEPLLPILPPRLLNTARMSATVRLTLSVSVSMKMAVPPGP